MARILYGVAGEGFGHTIRSRVVIEQLNKNHKIKVLSSAKSYNYLKKFFDVEKINYFKIIYRSNKAALFLTLLNNTLRLPLILAKGWKTLSIINGFKPDIVITDFEQLAAYSAFFRHIPVISIDNQHIITKGCHKAFPEKHWFDAFLTKLVIKYSIIKADKYFINSFYGCKVKDENTVLIKPLLRKEIINAKTTYKDHILVYQTSKSNKKLLNELQKINEKFIVYGFYENKELGNVILKDFNEREFFDDLSSCKAVIANGGFTLISEALYLKKPVLSIPVKRQFEQMINAIHLERIGYGMFTKETSKEAIEKFINNIPKIRKKLKNYKKYDNNNAFKKISDAVKSLS